MSSRLPDRIKMEIARRYKAGETSIALGKEYGIHSAFVRTIFQRSGLAADRPRQPRRNDKRAAVIAALRSDMAKLDCDIANEVGCSRSYVVTIRREIGIFRPRVSKHFAIHLSDQNAAAFHEAATLRGIAVSRLVDRVLAAVATDQMFDAVLDDRSEAA